MNRSNGEHGASTLEEFLQEACTTLQARGWKIVGYQDGVEAVWHIVAQKGAKLRVIQLVLPATEPSVLQDGRRLLGDAVRLPTNRGSMEQWLAHVRPDGHISFGPYILNGQRWADSQDDALERLGLAA
ncbi:MAG: hypothetical protein HY332_00270 [Chloroflexi bacterium]|nr:hypothetical protein [Chloroflexota bacterium]